MTRLEKIESDLAVLREKELKNYLTMSPGQKAKLSKKIDDLAQRKMKLMYGTERVNCVNNPYTFPNKQNE